MFWTIVAAIIFVYLLPILFLGVVYVLAFILLGIINLLDFIFKKKHYERREVAGGSLPSTEEI